MGMLVFACMYLPIEHRGFNETGNLGVGGVNEHLDGGVIIANLAKCHTRNDTFYALRMIEQN